MNPGDPQGLFDRVGGLTFFEDLVDRFYAGVEEDPVLAPMYPSDDLEGARRRLALFLAQYWGGPPTYSEERGHPRLRMRHARFPIDAVARQAWLAHMEAALDVAGLDPADRALMGDYVVSAAAHLQNQP